MKQRPVDDSGIVAAGEARSVHMGALGVRFIFAQPPGTGISVVEHPLAPRSLGSPVHTHADECKFSFRSKVQRQCGSATAS